MPKTQHEQASNKRLKRGGITGIAIGALALLACELPILLAIIGFGGLSASAAVLRPPPFVELVAVILFASGALVLLFLLLKRVLKHRKTRQT